MNPNVAAKQIDTFSQGPDMKESKLGIQINASWCPMTRLNMCTRARRILRRTFCSELTQPRSQEYHCRQMGLLGFAQDFLPGCQGPSRRI